MTNQQHVMCICMPYLVKLPITFTLQLFTRLQKMMLCLSRKRTIAYLDEMGEGFDAPVTSWKGILEDVFLRKQVHVWGVYCHIFQLFFY